MLLSKRCASSSSVFSLLAESSPIPKILSNLSDFSIEDAELIDAGIQLHEDMATNLSESPITASLNDYSRRGDLRATQEESPDRRKRIVEDRKTTESPHPFPNVFNKLPTLSVLIKTTYLDSNKRFCCDIGIDRSLIKNHYQLLADQIKIGFSDGDQIPLMIIQEYKADLAKFFLIDLMVSIEAWFFPHKSMGPTLSDYIINESIDLSVLTVWGFEKLISQFIYTNPNLIELDPVHLTYSEFKHPVEVVQWLKQSHIISDHFFPLTHSIDSSPPAHLEEHDIKLALTAVRKGAERIESNLLAFKELIKSVLFPNIDGLHVLHDSTEQFLNNYLKDTLFILAEETGCFTSSIPLSQYKLIRSSMIKLDGNDYRKKLDLVSRKRSNSDPIDYTPPPIYVQTPSSNSLVLIKEILKWGNWVLQPFTNVCDSIIKNIELFETKGLGGIVKKFYPQSKSIETVYLPGITLNIVGDPLVASHAFLNHQTFTRAPYGLIDRLFPNSVFTKTAGPHDSSIREMAPYLGTSSVSDVVDLAFNDMLSEHEDGYFDNVVTLFQKLTWDIISRYSLGLDHFKDLAEPLGLHINRALQAIVKGIVFPSFLNAELNEEIESCKSLFYNAVIQELDTVLSRKNYIRDILFFKIIEDVLLRLDDQILNDSQQDHLKTQLIRFKRFNFSIHPDSFSLKHLLESSECLIIDASGKPSVNISLKGSQFDKRFHDLKDLLGVEFIKTLLKDCIDLTTYKTKQDVSLFDAIMFLFAGHETTGLSLSWLMIHLCRNRGYLNKVENEVRNCNIDELETRSDYIRKCPLLCLAVEESFRITPASWAAARKSTQPSSLMGSYESNIELKKDSILVFPLHKLQEDPAYWGEITSFTFDPLAHFQIVDQPGFEQPKIVPSPNVNFEDIIVNSSTLKSVMDILVSNGIVRPFFLLSDKCLHDGLPSDLFSHSIIPSDQHRLVSSEISTYLRTIKQFKKSDHYPYYFNSSANPVWIPIIVELLKNESLIENVHYKLCSFKYSDSISYSMFDREIDHDTFTQLSKRLSQLKLSRQAFQPFISGSHACKGKQLAYIEIYRIFFSLLSKYVIDLDAADDIAKDFSATLKPTGSLSGSFRPRMRRRSRSFNETNASHTSIST